MENFLAYREYCESPRYCDNCRNKLSDDCMINMDGGNNLCDECINTHNVATKNKSFVDPDSYKYKYEFIKKI